MFASSLEQVGEITALGIIAPQLFVAGMVFTMCLSICVLPLSMDVWCLCRSVCVLEMSPPAVVPQVLLDTLVSAASC